ncbi:hypothetical protein EOPP23_08920 [Endozoicomonas sp. OPT23]|nr:hypothetical protein [Endozoicomonas sp. OPT23]
MGLGSVQSGGVINHDQKAASERVSISKGADNPGRINRHSITEHQAPSQLKSARLYPALDSKSLSQYGITSQAPSDVKVHLTPAAPVPERLSQEESIMFGRADRLIGRIETEQRKGGYEPQVRSEGAFEVQVSQARDNLKQAKNLLNQASGLDKSAALNMNLRSAGLGGNELSPAGGQAEAAIIAATELVHQRKDELEQAKGELRALKKRLSMEAKANEKSRKSEDKLNRRAGTLKADVGTIRKGIKEAEGKSSKAIGKELASVEAALKKAKSVQSSANKLLGGIQRESGKHGFGADALTAETKKQRAAAGSEVEKLKQEVAVLKTKRKAAQRQEKKEQREAKVEQKAMDQAYRKANQDFDKPTANKSAPDEKKETTPPTPTSERVLARGGAVRRKTGTKPQEKESITALQPDRANVAEYVRGITPSKKLGFGDIDRSISSVREIREYKQVLADIRASKLSLSAKQELRGHLSAALLGAMKDPAKFKHMTPKLIEHVMYGYTKDDIAAEYPKAVEREKSYLQKTSRRLDRG